MKLSEIRQELIGQHVELHHRMESARMADPTELHGALVRVADFLRMHNLREEELMTEVFPTLDAWGMIRAEVMVGEHLEEHRELWEAVLDIARMDPEAARAKATQLFEQLHVHMLREEKVFLNDDVLSDVVRADYFGG